MKVECLILESPIVDKKRITVTLNELIRSSCGRLGWLNRDEISSNNYGVRNAYAVAISERPDLPVISKVNQVWFKDPDRVFYYLYEYNQEELEKAYARLARRNRKTQHHANLRSANL